MASRMQLLTLPSVPATAATASGIVARITLHDTAAAGAIAGLAGLLALIAVFAVSPESQKTVRLWIRHRAEHTIARAESFEIRRNARAATCGRSWTRDGAREIREAAASSERPVVSLPDVMRITRLNHLDAAEQRSQNGGAPDSDIGENGNVRAPLEVVQDRAATPEQGASLR